MGVGALAQWASCRPRGPGRVHSVQSARVRSEEGQALGTRPSLAGGASQSLGPRGQALTRVRKGQTRQDGGLSGSFAAEGSGVAAQPQVTENTAAAAWLHALPAAARRPHPLRMGGQAGTAQRRPLAWSGDTAWSPGFGAWS